MSFFTDRVQLALTQQSNQLLGADLSIVSDRPFAAELRGEAAQARPGRDARLRFPQYGEPRRGKPALRTSRRLPPAIRCAAEVRLADALVRRRSGARQVPAPGTAWVDDRLLTRLNVKLGDTLAVGQLHLRIAALVTQEPDSAIGFLNSAPRLIMNEADVAASGLVQDGSRVRYRMYHRR